MIDITQLAIPAVIFLVPLFAGALKGYCTHKIIRITVDFVSPTISALIVMYFLDVILINTGIVTESSAASDILYICSLVVFVLFLWYGFFRLVKFGSDIADRNNAGLQSDIKYGLNLACEVIEPMHKTFESKMEEKIQEIMQQRNQNILDYLQGMYDVDSNLISKVNKSLEMAKQQTQKTDELLKKYSCTISILEQVSKYFENIPHLYEILLSRIEAIKTLQAEDSQDIHESVDTTVLTSEDGRANRIIGHKQQDEMAQILRDAGFDVKVGHGAGEADYTIKNKDGVIIAIGSNKSYTLHDAPKRMQRRITAKDCSPELILAKKLNDDTPMVLFVINRINGRKWMKVISSADLNSWNGISTPVMLAKDDEESRVLSEEEFANGIVSLGGKA